MIAGLRRRWRRAAIDVAATSVVEGAFFTRAKAGVVWVGGDGATEAREEGVPEQGGVAEVRAVAAAAHLVRVRVRVTVTVTVTFTVRVRVTSSLACIRTIACFGLPMSVSDRT